MSMMINHHCLFRCRFTKTFRQLIYEHVLTSAASSSHSPALLTTSFFRSGTTYCLVCYFFYSYEKRDETKRNETKRNETKQNETKTTFKTPEAAVFHGSKVLFVISSILRSEGVARLVSLPQQSHFCVSLGQVLVERLQARTKKREEKKKKTGMA